MESSDSSSRKPTLDAIVHDPKDVEQNKDIAAVSYLWVMSVILYFVKSDSPFIRFHSRQGIVLFLLSLPLWFIPIVGRLLELLVLCLMAVGFLNAAQGKWKDIAIVGPLSRGDITIRQAWRQFTEIVARFGHAFSGKGKPPSSPSSSSPLPPQS